MVVYPSGWNSLSQLFSKIAQYKLMWHVQNYHILKTHMLPLIQANMAHGLHEDGQVHPVQISPRNIRSLFSLLVLSLH